jgi:hypothetical protein
MTRDTSAGELVAALARLGRIDLADVWPVLKAWWSTPVTDLAASEEEDFMFLLSLAPARYDPRETIFAGQPPPAIAGRELVCLDFVRQFKERLDPIRSMGISGGAAVTLWYGYDRAWRELRERSDWIEMGASTPQLDAFARGDPAPLIQYVEADSGVLEAAARQRALALVAFDGEGDERLRVV